MTRRDALVPWWPDISWHDSPGQFISLPLPYPANPGPSVVDITDLLLMSGVVRYRGLGFGNRLVNGGRQGAKAGGDEREGVALLYRYLLFVRFALVNTVATGLLVAAYLQGWLDGVLTAYLVELSVVIFLVFLYGLVICGFGIWRHSVELNDVKAGTPDPRSRAGRYLSQIREANPESLSIKAEALRLKFTDRIAGVRHIANALIFLGLIGTVIGFIIALSGVDPGAATEVENVAAMISILINGMSVALHTTLVGAVLYIWLIVNYRILVTGTVDLIATIMELG